MKKLTLIIIGLILVLFLGGIWIFSLLYGSPEKGDIFANFNFFGDGNSTTTEQPPITEPLPSNEPPSTAPNEKLRQLTTRPVIGYREIQEMSDTATTGVAAVLYVEAGTGHVYKKNLASNEEVRISNITIPTAHTAAISPSGKYVAIQSTEANRMGTSLINLTNSPPTDEALPYSIGNIYFESDSVLLYSEVIESGTEVQALNLSSKEVTLRYSIPFQATTFSWSGTSSLSHYVYTKTTSQLLGYVYELKGGGIKRLPMYGLGLTALQGKDHILYTLRDGENYRMYSYSLLNSETKQIPLTSLAEKCVAGNLSPVVYCGHDLQSTYTNYFPDNWYKGELNFNDRIWRLNLEDNSMRQLVNPEVTAGRVVDIFYPVLNNEENRLYFLNKNDRTLWLYEL